MISVVRIENGEIQCSESFSNWAIQPRDKRIDDALWHARKFIHGIRIGADIAGLYAGGDTQYHTWIQLKDVEFRIRETLPDGSERWLDGRPAPKPW